MKLYKDLGRVVRENRSKKKLTQADLAAKIGINRVSIANIEAGHHQPTFHLVVALADHLEFALDEIVGYQKKERLDRALSKQPKELRSEFRTILAEERASHA